MQLQNLDVKSLAAGYGTVFRASSWRDVELVTPLGKLFHSSAWFPFLFTYSQGKSYVPSLTLILGK